MMQSCCHRLPRVRATNAKATQNTINMNSTTNLQDVHQQNGVPLEEPTIAMSLLSSEQDGRITSTKLVSSSSTSTSNNNNNSSGSTTTTTTTGGALTRRKLTPQTATLAGMIICNALTVMLIDLSFNQLSLNVGSCASLILWIVVLRYLHERRPSPAAPTTPSSRPRRAKSSNSPATCDQQQGNSNNGDITTTPANEDKSARRDSVRTEQEQRNCDNNLDLAEEQFRLGLVLGSSAWSAAMSIRSYHLFCVQLLSIYIVHLLGGGGGDGGCGATQSSRRRKLLLITLAGNAIQWLVFPLQRLYLSHGGGGGDDDSIQPSTAENAAPDWPHVALQMGLMALTYGAYHALGVLLSKRRHEQQVESLRDVKQDVRDRIELHKEDRVLSRLMDSVIPNCFTGKMRDDILSSQNAADHDHDHDHDDGKNGFSQMYVETYDEVSILFADIVNFTKLSSNCESRVLVETLNELFGHFDEVADRNSCVRVKILGDCYYCISGIPVQVGRDHARGAIEMGLDMIDILRGFARDKSKVDLNMRVGIHTGRIHCGVLGKRRWQFDAHSNDVDLANQMEQSGEPGRVHISEATWTRVRDKELFVIEPAYGERRNATLSRYNIKRTYFVQAPTRRRTDSINHSLDGPWAAAAAAATVATRRTTSLDDDNDDDDDDCGDNGGANQQSASSSLVKAKGVPISSLKLAKAESGTTPISEQRASQSSNCDSDSRETGSSRASTPALETRIQIEQTVRDGNDRPTTTTEPVRNEQSPGCENNRRAIVSFSPESAKLIEQQQDGKNRHAGRRPRRRDTPKPPKMRQASKAGKEEAVDDDEMARIKESQPLGLRPKASSLKINSMGGRARFKLTTKRIITAQNFIKEIEAPFAYCFKETSSERANQSEHNWLLNREIAQRDEISDVDRWTLRFKDPSKSQLYKSEEGRKHKYRGMSLKVLGQFALALALLVLMNDLTLLEPSSHLGHHHHHHHDHHHRLPLTNDLTPNTNTTNLTSATPTSATTATSRSPGQQDNQTIILSSSSSSSSSSSPANHSTHDREMISYYVAYLLIFLLTTLLFGHTLELSARRHFVWFQRKGGNREKLAKIRDSNKVIFYNLLPGHVADYFLKQRDLGKTGLYHQSYNAAGVMFANISNFGDFYEEHECNHLGRDCLRLLNETIGDFDQLLDEERFQAVDKIKTVGATFMAAIGLKPGYELPDVSNLMSLAREDIVVEQTGDQQPVIIASTPAEGPQQNARQAALEQLAERYLVLLRYVFELQRKLIEVNKHSYNNFHMRVGLSLGPVTAGVIGASRPQYDIWGNTVNEASRMESTSEGSKIQVTKIVYEVLKNQPSLKFTCRGVINVKGKGRMTTYFVEPAAAAAAAADRSATST